MVSLLTAAVGSFSFLWLALNLYAVLPLVIAKLCSRNPPFSSESRIERTITEREFSLLLPAYKEAAVVRRCIKRIYESNYPRNLIQTVVLTEKDDTLTRQIVEECERENQGVVSVVVEENGEPRGKPRALNQGMKYAIGCVVGVVDAEDLIDRNLLSAVNKAISEGHDVVQGVLDMQNEDDGWINRNFRAEYSFWFRRHLPAISVCKWPVPLGGTTNFFRRTALEEVGLWDAHNVTEDFELGMRLFARKKKFTVLDQVTEAFGSVSSGVVKYDISVLDSITSEESPTTLSGWMRQRTRWERGKIQTLFKLLKERPSFRDLLCVTVTGLTAHLGAINALGLATSVIAFVSRTSLPPFLTYLFWTNSAMLVFQCATQALGYLDATEQVTTERRHLKAACVALLTPVYWVLQWCANLRAIEQELFGTAVFWEKTMHLGRNV